MSDHDQCQELLPWYGNGTLNESEMALCKAHLDTCEVCRSDLHETVRQMRALNAAPIEHISVDFNKQALTPNAKPTHKEQTNPHWLPTLAAAVVLITAFVVTWISPTAQFQLLTDQPTESGFYVQLAFYPNTPEEDVRAFIRSSGGIVDGNPTAAGVYRLRYHSPLSAQALSHLQSHPIVAWANTEL